MYVFVQLSNHLMIIHKFTQHRSRKSCALSKLFSPPAKLINSRGKLFPEVIARRLAPRGTRRLTVKRRRTRAIVGPTCPRVIED